MFRMFREKRVDVAMGMAFLAMSFLLASCQTTPAVPYVPPQETSFLEEQKASVESLKTLVSVLGKGIAKLLSQETGPGGSRSVQRVAVPQFADLGGVSHALGRFLGIRVGGVLQNDRAMVLIDSGQIHQELRKEGLSQGILDTKSLLDVAAALHANRLVIGNYTDLGQMLLVTARILTVPDGVTMGEISETVPKDSSVMNLIHVGP
ncbi:MAG: hypothetical protein ACYCYP_08885 [Leptospirales bacterium]